MDHQAIAFQYYEHAYEMWLNELDEFVEANEDLDFRYSKLSIFSCRDVFETTTLDKKNEKVENDLREQREKLKAAQAELKKLKSSEVGRFLQWQSLIAWPVATASTSDIGKGT